MIPQLQALDTHEIELILKTPLLVCILIAGADDEIDKKEIRESITVLGKKVRSNSLLSAYFEEVSLDFEDKLKVLIQNYPRKASQRNPMIETELSQLNTLWSRLDRDFAGEFYGMLVELAAKIASSSGGVLGYYAVGSEEARYVKLSMIKKPF